MIENRGARSGRTGTVMREKGKEKCMGSAKNAAELNFAFRRVINSRLARGDIRSYSRNQRTARVYAEKPEGGGLMRRRIMWHHRALRIILGSPAHTSSLKRSYILKV